MTDFVMEQTKSFEAVDLLDHLEIRDLVLSRIEKYAKFLKQPLKLGMFIPCDEDGNVLEEPRTCCSSRECGCMGMPYNYDSQEGIDKYFEAKKRVLFEGFHYNPGKVLRECPSISNGLIHVFWFDNITQLWSKSNNVNTVEDLTKYNLTLTPTSIKQLGL